MTMFALTFLFAASAQGATPLPEEKIELPPDLTTPDAKIDWIEQELKLIDEQVAPELAKPQSRWSRPLIEGLAARARGLRRLGDPRRFSHLQTDADRALETLDRLQREQDSAERERKAKAEEKKQADRARQQREANIRANASTPAEAQAMIERRVWIGMSQKQAELSWGKPPRVSHRTTATYVMEIWFYSGGTLTFENGKLTVIDN
jgi:hypothetical protein